MTMQRNFCVNEQFLDRDKYQAERKRMKPKREEKSTGRTAVYYTRVRRRK